MRLVPLPGIRCALAVAPLLVPSSLPAATPDTPTAPPPATAAAPAMPASPAAAPGSAETLTIVGEKAAVEQGEKPIFTALPPRDLIERPLVESPGLETATTVIGAREIEWLNAYTVLDAMKYAPGAWTESRGRKEKQLFSVRGQRYPYPEYLVDGAWFREFTEAAFFLNAANVERIELLRSSSDLLLTPGGMAGSVSMVPKTYLQPETRLKADYGSYNTARGQISHGAPVGRGSYGLGIGYQHTDGPDDENGEENVGDLYGRILVPVAPRLELSLMGYGMYGNRELRLAEPPAAPVWQTRRESFDPMRYFFLVGKARYEAGDKAATELTLNGAYRRFTGHRVGSPSWTEKDAEWGARLVQSVNVSDANNLRLAGLYNHWRSPTGKRYYVGNPGDLRTYALAITDEHQFDRLSLNAGYRFSRTYVGEFGGFNIEGSAGNLASVTIKDTWEDPLHTANLGARYQLSDVFSLHANFTFGQIAARPGMLDATLNPPDTETRLKYDLGARAAWPAFGEIALTGFFVDQHDAPFALNQTTNLVDGAPFALYENTDARSCGLELDLRSRRFASGFQLFANGVLMTTRKAVDHDWDEDAEVPNLVLGGGLSYLYKRIEAALLAKHVGSYENNRFLPTRTPPVDLGDFTELSAILNVHLGNQHQHRLYLAVDNLTDKSYSTVAGYPNDGRFYRGGLSLFF